MKEIKTLYKYNPINTNLTFSEFAREVLDAIIKNYPVYIFDKRTIDSYILKRLTLKGLSDIYSEIKQERQYFEKVKALDGVENERYICYYITTENVEIER